MEKAMEENMNFSQPKLCNLILVSVLLFIIGACQTYTPQTQLLPQHIKKIAIRPFVNKTPELGLEDKLFLRVYDEFIHDGRYIVTKEEEADGVVVGEITYYILTPLSYGENFEPRQHKLSILLNLYFIDKKENVTLWSEPNFEGAYIFYVSTVQGGITEENAREIIWDTLAKKIFLRVIEGYGSATGISGKKVPQKTTE